MPRGKPAARLVAAAVAALICIAAIPLSGLPGARAETAAKSIEPGKSIEEVERDLKAARERERRLAEETAAQIQAIETLRTQLAAAALATQESEDELSGAESRLAGLDAEAVARSAELERRRAEIASLMAALTRLARNPPEALVLMPTTPIDTLRTARLLGNVVPPLQAQAQDIAQEIDDLRALHDRAAAERETLAAATRRLAGDRERLRGLVAQRAEFYERAASAHAEAAEQVDTLARQAADLHDLLRRLDDNRSPATPASADTVPARVADGLARQLRRLGDAHGQMAFPARGRILASYGEAGEGGSPQRGLTIETRPDAEVVAPYDGKIVFAGPFRGYGRILIIEHGEGYHTLLAGLGRIEVSVGQVVAKGEPIAATGSPDTAGPLDVSAPADIYSKGATGPVLYVELRRHGQPINPLPWLTTSNGKVSG